MRRAVEAGSKALVLASAVAALILETRLGWAVWGELPYWTAAAAVVSIVLVRWRPSIAWPLLLVVAPIAPALTFAGVGLFPPTFYAPWFAAMLGALAASTRTRITTWSFPARWRVPLACWSLVSAISWAVAAWRETDFAHSLSAIGGFGANAVSGNGGTPGDALALLSAVALAQLTGLLWFEWAMAEAADSTPDAFRRRVVLPSAAGACLAAALACYQGRVDVNFLNTHQWPALGRAGGALLDGDAAGVVLGLWSAGFLALALLRRRWWTVFGLTGAVLAWVGLWATGSRTALLSGAIGLVGLAVVVLRRLPRRAVLLTAVGLIVTAAGLLGIARHRATVSDPLGRLFAGLPAPNPAAIATFARTELFDRTAPYGTVSMRMIKRYPVGGVGLGGFEALFSDFAYVRNGSRFWNDNAQSWFRSELAELGLVGSLGWIVWLLMFMRTMWRKPDDAARAPEGVMVKSALIAVGLVSAVAMPTRNPTAAFTVWIFVAWCVAITDRDTLGPRGRVSAEAMNSRWAWLAAMVIALAAGGDLWHSSRTSLRPVARSVVAEWNYNYGLYAVETAADGRQYRWTGPHVVAGVSYPRTSWMRIAISAGPPDLATRPFGYRLYVSGKLIAQFDRIDGTEQAWYVLTRPNEVTISVELQTTRSWRPSDFGGADHRELGVIIEPFTFLDSPPHGARYIR